MNVRHLPDEFNENTNETDEQIIVQLPALYAFIQRLREERHQIRVANFRRIVRRVRQDNGYWHEQVVVKIARDRTVKFPLDDVQPTDVERAAIEKEVKEAVLPSSDWAICLPDNLTKVDPENLFVFRSQHEREGLEPIKQGEDKEKRHGILFVQVRVDYDDEEKDYLPWSYWDDGKWRPMEPEGPLPIYNQHLLNGATRVFLHEGAKAARAGQEIAEDRRKHPWQEELKGAVHVGWVGGATSPHRADIATIKKLSPKVDVIVVADNDQPGRDAVPVISKILGRRLSVINFDNDFEEGFDLADDWPKHEHWWTTNANGRDVERLEYKGTTFQQCLFPATWATELVKVGDDDGKLVPVLRDEAKAEWLFASEADRFIHRETGRDVCSTVFDAIMRPFSDHKQLSDLFKKAYSAHVDLPAYDPSRSVGHVFNDKDGKRKGNLHRPSNIRPKEGDLGPFIKYLEYMFPDKDDRDLVMQWCATLVALPGNKMNYGLLLVSVTQGVGKTTLGQDVLAPLVGEHNVSYPTENDIVNSNFNASYIGKKRLAVCNEIYSGHSAKGYNNLKSVITDKQITANEKYEKAYTLKNFLHVVACSNSRRALQIPYEDRRFLVPRVVEEKRSRDEWRELFAWLEDGGLSHIMWWAHEYVKKNEPVRPGVEAPMTTAKREMIDDQQSMGMKKMLALGEMMVEKASTTKQVVAVATALRWVLAEPDVDPRYENEGKLISMLLKSGVMEQAREKGKETRRFKVRGMKTRVVANFQILPGMTWEKDLEKFELKKEDLPWIG